MDGRDIRALREEGLNWDLQKFAHEVGVSPGTVRSWEEGRSKPSRQAREKMNKVFDENLGQLQGPADEGDGGSEGSSPHRGEEAEVGV